MKKFFLFAFATIFALSSCCNKEQKQTTELDQPMSIITETEISQVMILFVRRRSVNSLKKLQMHII